MHEKTEDGSSERRPIRVAIRKEHIEDVKGQSYHYAGFGQTEEDVEGQGWRLEPIGPDDTEGQVNRFLEPVGVDDTEGQHYKLEPIGPDDTEAQHFRLEPAGADDAEGQKYRSGLLKPEGDGTWTLELDDDAEGQGWYHP
jgi:hypothetical protein